MDQAVLVVRLTTSRIRIEMAVDNGTVMNLLHERIEDIDVSVEDVTD